MAQMVKSLLAMRETQVQSLEKRMATHSSVLAWKIPRTEKLGKLQPMGLQRVRHNSVTNTQNTPTDKAS